MESPSIHLWRHERAVVLGLRDSRLPKAGEAMDWLEQEGYQVMVRNSGGAAVPLDFGVVNVTLMQTIPPGTLQMKDDFRLMALVLAETLQPFGAAFDIGEISGSYCPGEFDLSVNGRKFCGLAQRRKLRSVAVQAFVNVGGGSRERAAVVREFYRRAGGDLQHSGALDVREEVMGSLTELVPHFPGAEAWIESLIASFGDPAHLPEHAAASIQDVAQRMRERYDPRCGD